MPSWASGILAAARASFGTALDLAPGYADANYGLALAAYREGDARRALDLVAPLVEQYPGRDDFAALSDRAAVALQPAAGPDPADDTARLMRRARELRLAGDGAAAEAIYVTVLGRNPDSVDALVGAGLASGAQGELDTSRGYLDAALERDPGNLDALLARARLAVWREDLGEARARTDLIRRRHPSNAEALLIDAQLSLIEGRLGRSAALFEAASEQDPGSADAVRGLGDARRLQGREASARAAYRRALALDPGSAEIVARLAAPAPIRWRVDAAAEHSDLTNGFSDWQDTSLAISHRPRPDTAFTALLRAVERFGLQDEQVALRLDRMFRDVSVSGLFAVTPDADVLAELSLGAGLTWAAPAPFLLTIDAILEQFDDSRVLVLRPGIEFLPAGDRFSFVAGLTFAADTESASATGVTLRAEARLTDRLALLMGAANAPEVSEGAVVEARSAFAGASFALTDDVSVTGRVAREEREAFDRDTISLVLTARF